MKVCGLTLSASRAGGGIFYAMAALMQALARRGELEQLALASADAHSEADVGEWGEVLRRVYPMQGPRALGFSAGMGRALRDFQPDITHVHGLWQGASWLNHQHCRRRKIPYVVSPHGMLDPWALRNSGWKKRAAGLAFENAHLRDAACLHALCEPECAAIRAYGLKQPIAIIPNGVDLPARSPAPPQGCPVLLYRGRLHHKKGLDLLLGAWARLREQNPAAREWCLALAGWGDASYIESLKTRARQHFGEHTTDATDTPTADLDFDTPAVTFVGPRFGDEKAQLFRRASAFVLPSQSEGLPVAVLEAWSYGLPAVLTPECNLPEGGAAGATIPTRFDLDALTQSLDRLVEMPPTERNRIGQAGRALVEKRFTWERIADNFLAVYRWLAESGSPPECVDTAR